MVSWAVILLRTIKVAAGPSHGPRARSHVAGGQFSQEIVASEKLVGAPGWTGGTTDPGPVTRPSRGAQFSLHRCLTRCTTILSVTAVLASPGHE